MGSKTCSLKEKAKLAKKEPNTKETPATISLFLIQEDKAKLIFVRLRTKLYRRLSINIAREICDFLSTPQLLLTNNGPKVYKFNPASKEFTAVFEITCMIGHGSIENFTLMGQNKAFMVLKDEVSVHQNALYFATYISATIDRFGCRTDRTGCAVIYDQSRDCVYIFGGLSMHGSTAYKRTERFRVANSQFEPLPDMLWERCWLGCCWHNRLVFLCGGGIRSIETFDPRTERFNLYAVLECDPKENTNCCAVSNGDELIIVSTSAVWTGRDTHMRKTKIGECKGQQKDVSGTAVLWANTLYFLCDCGSTAIDLKGGTKTKYRIPYRF